MRFLYMKQSILIVLIGLVIISCKSPGEKETDALTEEELSINTSTFQGEFIFTSDAAVLKGDSFIYGVTLNELAKDLGSKVEQVKTQEYDMVPVTVKGELNPKPEGTEGWDEILTITEIVHISKVPTAADIELKQK